MTTLLPSFAQASPREKAWVAEQLTTEQEWYRGKPLYRYHWQLARAIREGQLVKVENDDNIRCIRRFTTHPIRGSVPYLAPPAQKATVMLGRLWRNELEDQGLDLPSARLAVTSMTRSNRYQQRLVHQEGKLAAPESTHSRGMAFDVDRASYYLQEEGVWRSVCPPERQRQLQATLMMEKLPVAVSHEHYDPRVTAALFCAAQSMEAAGLVSVVQEYTDTINACLHTAVAPDAFAE